MHALLGLSSIGVALLIGFLSLRVQSRVPGWAERRQVQFFVLAAPVVILGLNVVALWHLYGSSCFLGAPPWDDTVGLVVPMSMGLIALAGLGLGFVRLGLMARIAIRGTSPDQALQDLASRLADQLGAPSPRLLIRACNRPLAFTFGLLRPTIVLSTWMIEHLDLQEQEAVLAHELAHVARRDYLCVWLGTVLRDAFIYLPASRTAHRQIWNEKEPACDDLAVAITHRPLALASALAKVWHQAVGGGPQLVLVPNLVGPGVDLESRIRRLMDWNPASMERPNHVKSLATIVGGAVITLGGLPLINILVIFVPMGCGPLLRMLS